MSARDLLAAAQVVLDGTEAFGQTVTFRGASVVVTIDEPPDNYRFNRQGDTPRGIETTVRVLKSVVAALTPATIPVAGESFIDADGNRHNVARVKPVDEHWYCTCNKSLPASAP